jgi:hypothetical protein
MHEGGGRHAVRMRSTVLQSAAFDAWSGLPLLMLVTFAVFWVYGVCAGGVRIPLIVWPAVMVWMR